MLDILLYDLFLSWVEPLRGAQALAEDIGGNLAQIPAIVSDIYNQVMSRCYKFLLV